MAFDQLYVYLPISLQKIRGFNPARVISVAAALPNYAVFNAASGGQYQWKFEMNTNCI